MVNGGKKQKVKKDKANKGKTMVLNGGYTELGRTQHYAFALIFM